MTWPTKAEYGTSGWGRRGVDIEFIYAFNASMNFTPMLPMNATSDSLPAGTLVSVSRGLYRHVGLLTEPTGGWERQVISLNPGQFGYQVVEEPLSTFARGKPVRAEPTRTALPDWAVLARARSGQHPAYDWLGFNCEHFARFALGQPIESPQLKFWTVATLVLGVAARR